MSRHVANAITAAAFVTIFVTGAGAGNTSAPGQQPPVNLTPPTISGIAQVGSSLTAAVGSWDGKRLTYAYQWLRCDSSGASCSAISGATSATRALSTTDLGARLRVVVTATNRYGSAAATSAATAAVVSAPSALPPPPPPPPLSPTITPPSSTSPPTISGTPQQGQTLNASTGSWTGTTPLTYTSQWQRCDSSGGSCTPVAGATATSYLLASADVGSTMRVSVTATNSVGSVAASSAATPVITVLSGSSSSATVDGRWYSTTSTFNTPIPAGTLSHPDNQAMINQFGPSTFGRSWLGPTTSSVPSIATPGTSTPYVTVQLNHPSCDYMEYQVRIPSGFVVENKYESHAVVLEPDGTEWNFYKMTAPGVQPLNSGGPVCPATSNWAAVVVVKRPAPTEGWMGKGYGFYSPRGSHINFGSGVIRPRDTQTPAGGTWDHAIAVAYHYTCNSAGPHPAYVAPANASDGFSSGTSCIPMGARLQIDPSINCATWPSIAGKEWEQQMCRTLQKYGLIIVDTGDGMPTQYYKQVAPYVYPWSWGDYIPLDLMARFRVIDWTKWTGA
jgi:hypothetical protein